MKSNLRGFIIAGSVCIFHAITLLSAYFVSFGSAPLVLTVGDAAVEVVATAPHPAASCDVVVAAPGDGRLVVMAAPVCPVPGELVRVWYVPGSNYVAVDRDGVEWWAFCLNIVHFAVLVGVVIESLIACLLVVELACCRFARIKARNGDELTEPILPLPMYADDADVAACAV